MIEKYLDADELKRLLSTLVVIVGCLIIAALFGIIVVPGLRNANKPVVPTPIAPVSGETGWLDITEFTMEKGKVLPPVDPETLIKPSPELLTRGKDRFKKYCTTCHGEQGKGNGPAARSMDPRPRDLTGTEGWINARDMPGVYKTVSQGIPDSSMTSFDYLTKRDRMALVHYVQSLGGFTDAKGSQAAVQALGEELAAPGEKTNNKIPVSMAITKLASEYIPPRPLFISDDDPRPGAVILRSVLTDASRASQVLHASGFWRNDPDALAQSILPGVPTNGFSPKLATLKPSEWRSLYDELLRQVKAK